MNYETLTVVINDRIAHVTLNRPDLRNAFNERSIAELALAFDELGRNELVRAVVLARTARPSAPART
jgi:methylglutaconyl-CoA hydratase